MIFINIEQIEYFLTVKKFQGFSKAAQELCISQSALSKQIKALEKEFDTVLFERNSRITKLTPAGEDFAVYSEILLNDYYDIIDKMKKYSIAAASSLNIGTISVISQYGLTSVIAAFKNKYPNIKLNIREDENPVIAQMLEKSEIDLTIARDINLNKNNFNIYPLADDELVVVASNKHPLSKKKYISFKDLKDENFILCTKSCMYDTCVKECKKEGFKPNVAYDVCKIETILGLVSENLGITIMANTVLKSFTNYDLSIHPLKTPISYNLVLATNKNTTKSKECNLFKDFIINELKQKNS